MGRVFISYAHEDREQAQRVCERLKAIGFDPWIDTNTPASREDISALINGQLNDVDAVLVLWSENSNSSVWVRGEALKGLEQRKYFGALLTPMSPMVPFNALMAPDISDWSGLASHTGWNTLVRGLADASSSSRANVLAALEAAQTSESNETEAAERQAKLAFVGDVADDDADSDLDEGPKYGDVTSLIEAARAHVASVTRKELSHAVVQAVLDQEMLRDAVVVVSKSENVERPAGATYRIVPTIAEAIASVTANDLIVIDSGTYEESIQIPENVRIVGRGSATARPIISGARNRAAVTFLGSARLENVVVEARHQHAAVHCERGQPILMNCDVRKFADGRDDWAAMHVAGAANPIVISTSVAATGCAALQFVQRSGGQFVGVSVVAMRGVALLVRGRPHLIGCRIEAIGNNAIEVRAAGSPMIEECEILGRGASVVEVHDSGRPRMRQSRVSAVRQLAFDFSDRSAGRFEGNVVSVQTDQDSSAPTERNWTTAFFGKLKSREQAQVVGATRAIQIVRVRGQSRPLFLSNMTADGDVLEQPGSYAQF